MFESVRGGLLVDTVAVKVSSGDQGGPGFGSIKPI